ncbi:MAG: type IVB secretion system protein IcmJDotN [Pseudomonadota bacterium]|nr:type IVB secretion system protein IcmJDotN [Pseudomonadota bacterium]MEC8977588.1 type IVB secretion system protein IcmJDotN [Pseudomonadota bacterium]
MKQVDLELKFSNRQYFRYCKRDATPGFAEFADKVKARDNNTCRYCGFKAIRHMSIANIDHNYINNKMKNLVTACPLCAQCHFVENIGAKENSGGTLIYMPEITQNKLNGIMHTVFCAILNATAHEAAAQTIYNTLRLRSKVVEKTYGEGRSDPKAFGEMVINSSVKNSPNIQQEIMKSFRILPKLTSFADQIKDWSKDAVSTLETDLSVYGNQ